MRKTRKLIVWMLSIILGVCLIGAISCGEDENISGSPRPPVSSQASTGDSSVAIDTEEKESSGKNDKTSVDEPSEEKESSSKKEEKPSEPELVLGEAYSDNLENSNDINWYKVSIPADGYITIDFKHETLSSTSRYWVIRLYMSDQVTEYGKGACWEIKGNENYETAKMGVAEGIYYIKINDYSFSDATYNLTVNYTEDSSWEKEFNNELEDATDLVLNEAKNGNLASSNDIDWYKLVVEKDGYITIDFKHEIVSSTNRYWVIRLYMSDGVTEYGKGAYWEIKGNENYETAKMGVAEGVYYIKISDYSFSDATYSFTVNYTEDSSWEKEVNNELKDATDLVLKEAKSGNLASSNDVDWYKLVVEEDGYITIKFEHEILSSTSRYWVIRLYMSDGVTEYGKGACWEIKGNENYETAKMGVAEGVYYIKINDYSFSDATYSLTVRYAQTNEWERENNNEKEDAIELMLNKGCWGNLVSSNDTDWYKITLPYGMRIAVMFNHMTIDSSNTYWSVTMYESDAVTKVASTWSVKGNKQFVYESTSALSYGTYYIKVTDNYFSNVSYQIIIAEM